SSARNEEHARRFLEKMVARDSNHPSVIFWSVSNEVDEQDRRVVEWNDRQVQWVRSLDPTRLVMHVSERGRGGNCRPLV
ncbi:MAG: glycoside hydrolase family 2 TIM barrel-domain containing protein, partial [bacterium]